MPPERWAAVLRLAQETGSNTVYPLEGYGEMETADYFADNAVVRALTPGDDAINWRQLLPMLKFPLYPTAAAVIPWAQLMFGYLRITKRKHHALVRNIVPTSATWKPFA